MERLHNPGHNEYFEISRTSPEGQPIITACVENGKRNCAVQELVITGYSAYTGKELSREEIENYLCEDYYNQKGLTHTVVANFWGETKATLRLIMGSKGNEEWQAIDAQNWVGVQGNWPHERKGLDVSQIGELGKFAFDPGTPRETKQKMTLMLYRATEKIAERQGIKMLYAIMPSGVAAFVDSSGVRIEKVENMFLKEEDPKAKTLFDNFPGYWKKFIMGKPELYVFKGEK